MTLTYHQFYNPHMQANSKLGMMDSRNVTATYVIIRTIYICMYVYMLFMQGKRAFHYILLRTTEPKRWCKLHYHELWLHARVKGLISV